MSKRTERISLSAPGEFQPGHPRFGGRRRNSTTYVRELADSMGVCPIEFMVAIVRDGVAIQTVIEDGKRKKVEVSADLALRADLAKFCSRFIAPTLTSTQASITDERSEKPAFLDAILADPNMAKMAQTLALKMAGWDPVTQSYLNPPAAAQTVDVVPEPEDSNGN